MNIETLREQPFYHVYRKADPILYEILMDTLHTMWVMRQAARAEGKFIYDTNYRFDFAMHKELLYDIDRETGIRLRYILTEDSRIERLAWRYSKDYEEIFRMISIYHRQNIYTFTEAFSLVESTIETRLFIFSQSLSEFPLPWI